MQRWRANVAGDFRTVHMTISGQSRHMCYVNDTSASMRSQEAPHMDAADVLEGSCTTLTAQTDAQSLTSAAGSICSNAHCVGPRNKGTCLQPGQAVSTPPVLYNTVHQTEARETAPPPAVDEDGDTPIAPRCSYLVMRYAGRHATVS